MLRDPEHGVRMAQTDRAFRSLARAQPEVVATMLRALLPSLLPAGAALVPDDVAPTQIDALPPGMDADWAARVDADDLVHVECQGYDDTGFSSRLLWYHVGFGLRNRGKRRVRTVALWLTPLPKGQRRKYVAVDDIRVRVTTIVLPEVPASLLLVDGRTACFAAGAEAGDLSDAELCGRVAAALAERNASWAERHMAVMAAAMRKRYKVMVAAMEQANLEPVIIEDLVKFGKDMGRTETWVRLIARRLGRALTAREQETLEQRLGDLGEERIDDVVLNSGPDAVAAWLADASAR
jgi:hypothetical protein